MFSSILRRSSPVIAAGLTSVIAARSNCEAEDKYENLPEEDEETGCTICMINRNGPCRPLWRKFEYCLKDHQSKEDEKKEDGEKSKGEENSNSEETSSQDDHHDDDEAKSEAESLGESCDKYMMPWLECVQSHRNLYQLFTNQVYQREYVDIIEESLLEVGKPEKWTDPIVDMSDIVSYLKEKGYLSDDLSPEQSEAIQNWRPEPQQDDEEGYLEQEPIYDPATFTKDPELLDVRISVNLKDQGLPIDIAYARDETGRVLGFEQFKSAQEQGVEESVLILNTEPFKTRKIKLFKLYKAEEKDEDGNDPTIFYESKWIPVFETCLSVAAQEAEDDDDADEEDQN